MVWDPVSELWPAAQTQPTPVFVREVVLEHSRAHSIHTSWGCFLTTKAELSCQNKNHVAHKADGVYSLTRTEKGCDPALGESLAKITGAGKRETRFHPRLDVC